MTCTIEVEPDTISVFEMLQPPLPISGDRAAIYIDGTKQRRELQLNVGSHMNYSTAQLVLVSRSVDSDLKGKIDTAIEEAAASSSPSGMGGYGGMGGYVVSGHEEYMLAREPRPLAEWSANWLGYTRYMAVMITRSDFSSMPREQAEALRSYVLSGGTLAILYRSKQPSLAAWSEHWPMADLPTDESAPENWSSDFGLGSIQMIQTNPPLEWDAKRWMNQLDLWRNAARSRATVRDTESANRDMPVVEGQVTPARGMLLVMVIFAVVIGPINILVLKLLKRPMLLLLTVPLIALIFSAGVMVYSILSEGISPKARTQALTLLDQRAHRAVTVGVCGYYAPLTPGNGVWFDENTAVTPQVDRHRGYYYGGNTGRARSLDVTNGQHLYSGWVAARVPAHLLLRKCETRRERLQVTTEDDGTISVVNGLGSDIVKLVLVDHDGRRWTKNSIPAGQNVALDSSAQKSEPQPSSIPELIRRDDWTATKSVARNPDEFLTPGSYFVQLGDSPFLDPGLKGLKDHTTQCVVMGYYGEVE